ncbi:hypothetical protein LuPra_01315 [Luteitalea pratensis]|uniref:DUF2169 domain-containing protein n=1 Tax=Luteitalea pratensis TaxID=1855912 RepID=A0A143PHU8_LUTPR|nr:hypothetical protein LuPra_01315 [Luteitalea pratensis]
MLQLQNTTPFKTAMAVLPDRAGIDTLYVVVKATLHIRPKLSLSDEQAPVVLADEYYGDPTSTSLRVPSELHIGKPGTDVLLIGSAWAPAGRPVRQTQVSVAVAGRQRTMLVTGDRVWRDGRPSDPRPFESMPLVWERAFGGSHRRGEVVLSEERNPVGCGFAGEQPAGDQKDPPPPPNLEGQPLPNIESPEAPLQQPGQKPAPICLAPIAASWLPRRAFAGTYDERWQRSRAPYLPDDFDPRFLQCAAPDFAFDRYLTVGEQVHVSGALPDGPIALTIPDPRLVVAVTVAGTTDEPAARLETLWIEPDQNRVCLTWRAAFPCDRRVLKVEKIVVSRAGSAEATS